MLKKLIKQSIAYSFLFGAIAFFTPAAVNASDATQVSLYGINTGIIFSNTPAFTPVEVAAIALSIVVGIVLIVNGKFLKKTLNK